MRDAENFFPSSLALLVRHHDNFCQYRPLTLLLAY